MSAYNILIYKTKFLEKCSMADIVSRLEKLNITETKMIVENYDEEECEGIYVYSKIYKTKEYNIENNLFETITRKKYVVVEFHLDVKNNFLDIWGNDNKAQKVISALSLAFDNKIVIDPLLLRFSKLIDFLGKQENIFVRKVSARKVPFSEHLLVDCTFDLSNDLHPFDVIEKYKTYIQKINFKWKVINMELKLVIYISGAVTIYKERYQISDEELKQIYSMMVYAGEVE